MMSLVVLTKFAAHRFCATTTRCPVPRRLIRLMHWRGLIILSMLRLLTSIKWLAVNAMADKIAGSGISKNFHHLSVFRTTDVYQAVVSPDAAPGQSLPVRPYY
ncbi:MAG: hypothetical protein H6661_08020 [Ardenticatenaceae bacterium]|nr:hypothetical protein [Ardenticatenaceae bacterium]